MEIRIWLSQLGDFASESFGDWPVLKWRRVYCQRGAIFPTAVGLFKTATLPMDSSNPDIRWRDWFGGGRGFQSRFFDDGW
jgi:hypothetical protein